MGSKESAMKKTNLAAVAVAAGLALSACGQSDDLPPPPPQTEGAVLGDWVLEVCDAVAAGTEEVTLEDPESTDLGSEELFAAYAEMFATISSGQEVQHQGLEAVGPPPDPEIQGAYDDAMERLDTSRQETAAAAETLSTGPQGPEDIQEVFGALEIEPYSGFVADIAEADERIADVVQAADRCAEVR
jgi:hypothetical protein